MAKIKISDNLEFDLKYTYRNMQVLEDITGEPFFDTVVKVGEDVSILLRSPSLVVSLFAAGIARDPRFKKSKTEALFDAVGDLFDKHVMEDQALMETVVKVIGEELSASVQRLSKGYGLTAAVKEEESVPLEVSEEIKPRRRGKGASPTS